MKSVLRTTLAFGCIVSLAFTTTYDPKPGQYKGEIIQRSGKNLIGYVDLNGSDKEPWKNQKSVKFFTEDAAADGKVKGKEMQKFKPKDCAGYTFEGRTFDSRELSLDKVLTGIGMGKKGHFLEKLVDGKVELYKVYATPEELIGFVTEEDKIKHREECERIIENPDMIMEKDGDWYALGNSDLRDMIGDCETVLEKYHNGDYGFTPTNPDAETKVGKLIANASMMEKAREVLPEIIADYNSACGQ